MDKIKAATLEKSIKGKEINGYEILCFINNGKSAAVFKVRKKGQIYALKIFDSDLIDRFGNEMQVKRIKKEISLKGHQIENLIKIHDGGFSELDGKEYYYILMEFIEGRNLKEFIEIEDYDLNFILKVIRQLISTSEQLISSYQIAHRDIKPENIMIDGNENTVLMDLGVIKHISIDSGSDADEKQFLGTLRYASPEFLLREEEDSVEGWRSLNIYQIGGVLHDLIMKKELFNEVSPYPNLVMGIVNVVPTFNNDKYPVKLLSLARNMLCKDWRKRLELIPLNNIDELLTMPKGAIEKSDVIIEKLKKKRLIYSDITDTIAQIIRTKQEITKIKIALSDSILSMIREVFHDLKIKELFKTVISSSEFSFDDDKRGELLEKNLIFKFSGGLEMGFSRDIFLLIRISNDENNFAIIEALGFLVPKRVTIVMNDPKQYLRSIIGVAPTIGQVANRVGRLEVTSNFMKIEIFKGIISLDDSFKQHLSDVVIIIMDKLFEIMSKEVDGILEAKKQRAKTNKRIFISESTAAQYIRVNSL